MALLGYNLTTSNITLPGINVTLSAAQSIGKNGAAQNLTAKLVNLAPEIYEDLEDLRVDGQIDFFWSEWPEYDTGALYVRGRDHLRLTTNATRPDASTLQPGTAMFNLDDQAPNYVGSDGQWHDALGNIT